MDFPELEPPVVRLTCRRCDLEVQVALDSRGDMTRTMREFFEQHLSGSAVIDISAVPERAAV